MKCSRSLQHDFAGLQSYQTEASKCGTEGMKVRIVLHTHLLEPDGRDDDQGVNDYGGCEVTGVLLTFVADAKRTEGKVSLFRSECNKIKRGKGYNVQCPYFLPSDLAQHPVPGAVGVLDAPLAIRRADQSVREVEGSRHVQEQVVHEATAVQKS